MTRNEFHIMRKSMKKINKTIFIALGAIGIMILGLPAMAASNISFSPVNATVAQGKNFNLTIKAEPQGAANFTVKAEVKYPADILEVKSFVLGNGWMAIPQPGYDLIDNQSGLLIKTAGYPGGFSSALDFGVITFSAKKSGSGVIKLGDNSLVLDSTNSNVLASASVQTAVSITAAVAPSAPKTTPKTEETLAEEEGVPEAVSAPEEEAEGLAEQPTGQKMEKTSLLAAIGGIISLGTDSVAVGIIVSVIFIAVILLIAGKIYLKKKSV